MRLGHLSFKLDMPLRHCLLILTRGFENIHPLLFILIDNLNDEAVVRSTQIRFNLAPCWVKVTRVFKSAIQISYSR
jgi:hypothetical protein